eukprot:1847108-Amphidinium_carterae.1
MVFTRRLLQQPRTTRTSVPEGGIQQTFTVVYTLARGVVSSCTSAHHRCNHFATRKDVTGRLAQCL